jgi:excisionase family DNA binding protein
VPDLVAAFPHHGEAEAGPDHLLSRPEVAERLRVSHRTVRRLGAAGLLEEIRVSERLVKITERSVEQHLAERRINRGAQAVSVA